MGREGARALGGSNALGGAPRSVGGDRRQGQMPAPPRGEHPSAPPTGQAGGGGGQRPASAAPRVGGGAPVATRVGEPRGAGGRMGGGAPCRRGVGGRGPLEAGCHRWAAEGAKSVEGRRGGARPRCCRGSLGGGRLSWGGAAPKGPWWPRAPPPLARWRGGHCGTAPDPVAGGGAGLAITPPTLVRNRRDKPKCNHI